MEPLGFEVWLFPLLWLLAFTTACYYTVQAATRCEDSSFTMKLSTNLLKLCYTCCSQFQLEIFPSNNFGQLLKLGWKISKFSGGSSPPERCLAKTRHTMRIITYCTMQHRNDYHIEFSVKPCPFVNNVVVETHLRTRLENNAFSCIWKTMNLKSFAVILVRWKKIIYTAGRLWKTGIE